MAIMGTNGPDTIYGTPQGDVIYGLGGDDHLYGLAGGDFLDGGSGVDTMEGGAGNDTYVVDNARDRVVEAAGGGSDFVYVQTSWTVTAGQEIEAVLVDAAGPISLTGNLHSDSYALQLTGNDGINTLGDGGGRADLFGGYGNDTYIVTSALTTVHEFDGLQDYNPGLGPDAPPPPPNPGPLLEGYDTVRTNLATYTLPANVEVLTYFGSGAFHGVGNDEANAISGGPGNDTLDGGAGVDRLVGGAGNDTYVVDDARDFVVEQPGGGTDTILATASSYAAPANVEALAYIGSGNFSGFANATGTSLSGGGGNDYLHGGAGADVLDGDPKDIYGASGAAGTGETDTLYGGGGPDAFILHPSGYAVERIIDYTPGTDHLQIADPNTPSGGEFTTVAPEPVDGGHDIVSIYYYDQPRGALYYVDFLSGGVDSHLIATFDNHPALSQGDFVFTG